MAKDEDTRSEEEPDDVETETDDDTDDEEETSESGDSGWTRLEETIDKVVGKRLSEWRPDVNNSSHESSREKRKAPQSRKPSKKKGFLDRMFEGL